MAAEVRRTLRPRSTMVRRLVAARRLPVAPAGARNGQNGPSEIWHAGCFENRWGLFRERSFAFGGSAATVSDALSDSFGDLAETT